MQFLYSFRHNISATCTILCGVITTVFMYSHETCSSGLNVITPALPLAAGFGPLWTYLWLMDIHYK